MPGTGGTPALSSDYTSGISSNSMQRLISGPGVRRPGIKQAAGSSRLNYVRVVINLKLMYVQPVI